MGLNASWIRRLIVGQVDKKVPNLTYGQKSSAKNYQPSWSDRLAPPECRWRHGLPAISRCGSSQAGVSCLQCKAVAPDVPDTVEPRKIKEGQLDEQERYGLPQDVLMWVYGLGRSLTAKFSGEQLMQLMQLMQQLHMNL